MMGKPATRPTRSGPPAGGSVTRNERRILSFGFGFVVLGVAGFWLLMTALERSAQPDDPDANTPVIVPDYPRHLIDFSLFNQTGHAVTRQDLEGKFVVVNFLFTSCSITCPYVDAQMDKIAQATVGRKDVRLFSITLDPVDDTVPVLASYSNQFNANPSQWWFVTGSETVVHNLVETSFLPPDTTGQFSYMPGNFAHVNRIVLVDKSGHILSYFDGLNQNAADAVLARMKKLESWL
jgi:protein SCO1/2